MELTTKLLTPETWDDFAALVERNNGVWGGCWCIGFHATAAVTRALEEIRDAGGGVVEAYPEQTEERKPQRGAYLHTGPEELYAGFGFERVRRIAKWRWVMRLTI
jgi:hypothetical protein